MLDDTPKLSPELMAGQYNRNIKSARKAVAVAFLFAWKLEGAYNGSDVRSYWTCELEGCGKVVEKFYSHIRGRKLQDGTWKPSPRHEGCLPVAEREAALKVWRDKHGLNEAWQRKHGLI
ncbi:hypothetical protein ACIRLA_28740 [Streptomyces sp. NPDC102364]|uniref:hypothetical protein n=1 Tax=Streptomyces sp. NPDC102364 TaxID=3366161 RepID=UPI00380D17A6